MERDSCNMPCLTKAWKRTLPNIAVGELRCAMRRGESDNHEYAAYEH
jgi:hypothetical protein